MVVHNRDFGVYVKGPSCFQGISALRHPTQSFSLEAAMYASAGIVEDMMPDAARIMSACGGWPSSKGPEGYGRQAAL